MLVRLAQLVDKFFGCVFMCFVCFICCVSCGSVCWLGRLGWWTSEKKLLAGRSIRPAMMDRGETR